MAENEKSMWSGLMKKKVFQRKASASNLHSIEKNEKKEVPEQASMGRPRSFSSAADNNCSSSTIIQPKVRYMVPKARKKPQFGILLTDLMEQNPSENVPGIVVACVTEIKKDLRKEGIFRIPGRMTDILEMKISYEQGKGLGIEEPDIYAVAGLLSQFFRETPEPLLTYSLYEKWVALPKLDSVKFLKRCARLLKKLPPANFNLLKYFIKFLCDICKHAGANRMSSKNLALIFGASLINPPDSIPYDLNTIKYQCDLIELLIVNYTYIFEGLKQSPRVNRKKAERQVATIPAGAPKFEPKKKKSFFERAQLSSSASMVMSMMEPRQKSEHRQKNKIASTRSITTQNVMLAKNKNVKQ